MTGDQFVSGDGPYACPCCGYLTLGERGAYDIRPVCFWEDDGQDAETIRSGPNRGLTLSQGRSNFAAFGASDEKDLAHVRPPQDEEHPLSRSINHRT